MSPERLCVDCGALLIRVRPPRVPASEARCTLCRDKRRTARKRARRQAAAAELRTTRYCAYAPCSAELDGKRQYCNSTCRARACRERLGESVASRAQWLGQPSGVDYLERAEAHLYPGRGYHALTREERAAVYECAVGLRQAAIADGTYVDPMARTHAYDAERNRAERAVA